MSMDQAKEKGIPPEADVTGDNVIQGWEAGRSAARSSAMKSKTAERKVKEAKDLQAADERLAKVLEPQTRVLDEKFKKREEIIYNELMRRILNQGK